MFLINSPVSSFSYRNETFFVKRDDLLGPKFNGNKARKLAYYLPGANLTMADNNDFAKQNQDILNIDTVISYGGSQSNLMYSLSVLAKLKKWRFIYYTKSLSKEVNLAINGNLAASLANEMELVEIKQNFTIFCRELHSKKSDNQLVITQGGAVKEAEYGISQLACEIRLWAKNQNFADLTVFVASGTGTTALFLQKHLPEFTVYTTNCVGDFKYLTYQFLQLVGNDAQHLPIILPNNLFRFATPYPELYKTISAVEKASQIEFDLVYDPIGWHILLASLNQIRSRPILYIHCGGILGNTTMLNRYRYANYLLYKN